MYLPQHFEEMRAEELHRVIREYPLGVLVVNGPHGLDANHLPFELCPDDGGRRHLLAHVARANSLTPPRSYASAASRSQPKLCWLL